MDVALLGEIEVQGATTASPSRLKVFHDVLEQGQRSKDTDFLPVKGSRSGGKTMSGSTVENVLLVGLNAILLGSDKIEECLCTGIELMESSILALRPSLFSTFLIEDGEEERAVVQSAVLDRVVQLGHL